MVRTISGSMNLRIDGVLMLFFVKNFKIVRIVCSFFLVC